MKPIRTEAIVLRRTNFGEADRIIQFLTPLGQLAAIARSARKQKSKLAGGIELFAVCDVVISPGKGDLGVLTSARLNQFYRHIIEDYDRLQFAYEVLRLIQRASEMVDEPEWYEVAASVLAALDSTAYDLRLVKTWFYLHYAELLGHGLGLYYDQSGKKLEADMSYRYDPTEQSLRLSEQGDLHSAHITFLRLASTKPLMALGRIGGLDKVLDESLRVAHQHAAVD